MTLSRREIVKTGSALAVGCALPAFAAPAPAGPPAGTLSNPAASPQARALYQYLWSIYGKQTLTGQMESNFSAAGARVELDYIQKCSGKLPAILGLDYINPADTGVNDRATRWYKEEGGIVTLCWHWGAPDIGTGYENSKKDFDVAAAFKPGTPQNKAMARDLSWCADQLAVLRDRGVPVLWRPFHEFSGDWFWWGKHGSSGFKALWRLMYEYFTHERKLDNLLWVCGYAGQNVDRTYYPGRDVVDLAGSDIYVHDHGNLSDLFRQTRAIVGETVPICLHENGPIPDPDTLGPNANWLYFMTWHTNFIMDGQQNTPDEIKRFYNSQRYLTKDELPKLAV